MVNYIVIQVPQLLAQRVLVHLQRARTPLTDTNKNQLKISTLVSSATSYDRVLAAIIQRRQKNCAAVLRAWELLCTAIDDWVEKYKRHHHRY